MKESSFEYYEEPTMSLCQHCNFHLNDYDMSQHSCLKQIREDINKLMQDLNAFKHLSELANDLESLKKVVEKQGKATKNIEKEIDS